MPDKFITHEDVQRVFTDDAKPNDTIASLQRDLEAERTCNRAHLARINRLNALLVRYEREGDEAETTIVRLTAELAEARAGILKLPY